MDELSRIRHSCAHVLATAVLRIWPDAKLDIGPPTEEGFYYDFDLEHRFTPDDFEKIEAEMKKIVKENQVFEFSEMSREEAKSHYEKEGQPYKLERIDDIPEDEKITFFRNGEFFDLCAGPHVPRTGNVKAFKLLRLAAAYYRGNEKNPQLQRIYGTAFKNKTQLNEWLEMREEAAKRSTLNDWPRSSKNTLASSRVFVERSNFWFSFTTFFISASIVSKSSGEKRCSRSKS